MLYYSTGPQRDAAQTILDVGGPFVVHAYDTHITVEKPATHPLSSGERVVWHVLESLDRRGESFRLSELNDLDDRYFDAVIAALLIARGRLLGAAS